MPYYLNNASSASAAVNIPSIVVGATVGDYIEVKAVANSGNPSNNYRVIGQQSGFSNFIEIRPASAALACGGSSVTFTTGYTQPAVGTIFTVRFTRASSTTWRCTFNGSVLGSDLFNSANLTIDCIGRFANSTTEAFRGGFYYVAISTNGGTSATRYYDPSGTSSGTTLLDTVGSQNGSQVGTWPSGDSEWVFYSSGASNTATVSGTLPKIIGSVALNEINPINTASVNGQLPKLAGTISLLQKQSASVAGQLPKLTGAANLRLKQSASVSGQLPKLSGSIALQSASNNKQIAVTATLPKITSNIQLSQKLKAAVAGQMPKLTADIQLKLAGVYPQADADAYTYSFRIDGNVFATAVISESIAFNAIIEQQTVIKYAVN